MDRALNRAWQRERTACRGTRSAAGRASLRALPYVVLLAALVCVAAPTHAQSRRATPKSSPTATPAPVASARDDLVAELRETSAALGELHDTVSALGTRLDRIEATLDELSRTATPMREEVRGLYVETSNVRSEIARLEQKSDAEAESVGRSRYVLTLLLVATAVLQLVVLAVLLRSR